MDRVYLEKLVRVARLLAVENTPVWAPAVSAVKLRFSEHVPTAAVTRTGVVYFGYGFVQGLLDTYGFDRCVSMLGWVWVHEVSHWVRDHAARWEELCCSPLPPTVSGDRAEELARDHRVWNVAADMEVNDSDFGKLEQPRNKDGTFIGYSPGLLGLPSGLLAEDYFWQLLQSPHGRNLLKGVVEEGSGVHGVHASWEDQVDNLDGAGSGVVGSSTDGVPTLEKVAIQKTVAQNVLKYPGTLPGSLIRWARKLLEPRVDWRAVLRRVVTYTAFSGQNRCDYTWSRPNRRGECYWPFIVPSVVGGAPANVVVLVDVSQSIDDELLTRFVSEVGGLLLSCAPPVRFVTYDTRVTLDKLVHHPSELVSLDFRGGGGTLMDQGVVFVMRYKPSLVVVLTDGYTPYPKERFSVPVFWVLGYCGGDQPPAPPPPWDSGDFVVMDLT